VTELLARWDAQRLACLLKSETLGVSGDPWFHGFLREREHIPVAGMLSLARQFHHSSVLTDAELEELTARFMAPPRTPGE